MTTNDTRRHENPLPQLVSHRVRDTAARLGRAAWGTPRVVSVRVGPIVDVPIGSREALAADFEFYPIQPGEILGTDGAFAQRWAMLDLPDIPKKNTWLRWHGQGETTLHVRRDESLKPWAGLDIAHEVCPLPASDAELWAEIGLYQTGIVNPLSPREIKTPAGLRFDGAWLVDRDDDAWRAHIRLDTLYKLLRTMLDEHGLAGTEWGLHQPAFIDVSPALRHLAHELDGVVRAYRSGGATGVLKAMESLADRLPAEAWQPICDCVGHAHIDLVWLWPEIATHRKAIHTFSTVLRLMEQDDDFVYSHSSPSLFREIERLEPGLYDDLRARIGEHRFELTGAMEVESDTHMPCGEALARGIVMGQQEIARIRGEMSSLCWLPDVFGYSAALPQILNQSGVERFYTSKLSWSAVTRFPHNSFVWQGYDGSELLAHVSWCGYNNEALPATAIETSRVEQQIPVHNSMLMPTGFGDGGGGPTVEMCERVRAMQDLTGVPQHRWSSAESFFDRLSAHQNDLPCWRGELYLEYHRGTYTSRRDFKRAFRAAERALQTHEAAAAFTGSGDIGVDAWRRVVFAQFHDAIPGSSIDRVYQELTPELVTIAANELERASDLLGGVGDAVFNPIAIDRRLVVDGELYDLPALSVSTTPVEPGAPVAVAGHRSLENGLVRADFDDAGRLVSLVVRGEDVSPRSPVGLAVYRDEPGNFPAWDIDHDVYRSREEAEPTGAIGSGGGVSGVVEAGFRFGDSSATVRWTLHADEDVLRAEIDLDMHDAEQLVRLEVPTRFDGSTARFGCAFGAVDRGQHPRGPEAEAMWEVPASRWAAVVDEERSGLAIVSESSYGFSARDGVLGVSLVRTAMSPDESLRVTDLGTHTVRLALGAHRERSEGHAMSTAARAEALFADVVRSSSADRPSLAQFASLGSIVPAWVKPERGGLTIRVHETAGVDAEAVLVFDGMVEAKDLVGRPMPGVVSGGDGGRWTVRLRAYGLAGLICTKL